MTSVLKKSAGQKFSSNRVVDNMGTNNTAGKDIKSKPLPPKSAINCG